MIKNGEDGVRSDWLSRGLFFLILIASATPWISPPVALALGLGLALFVGNPFRKQSSKWAKLLLQAAVAGLGFGMTLDSVVEAGSDGFFFAAATIVGTLIAGLLLGKLFGVDRKIGDLVSSGTAICGGSAIAAVGPVINADSRQMSVSLGTVFVLNAIALFIFPVIGGALDLSQTQFGIWAAVAIHDTSSVVGAAAKYGSEALEVATTVKLTRALWIIPLALGAALWRREKKTEERVRVKIPWFILFFVLAVVVRTLLGDISGIFSGVAAVARQAMVVTLFLIGAGLSREMIRSVGVRPFLLGVTLWILIAGLSLWAITGSSM